MVVRERVEDLVLKRRAVWIWGRLAGDMSVRVGRGVESWWMSVACGDV